MARVFEAVFNLYRVIPCYDRCHLFGVHADPCRIEPSLIKQCKNSYMKVFMREVGEGMHDDEYKVELQGENIVAVKI